MLICFIFYLLNSKDFDKAKILGRACVGVNMHNIRGIMLRYYIISKNKIVVV